MVGRTAPPVGGAVPYHIQGGSPGPRATDKDERALPAADHHGCATPVATQLGRIPAGEAGVSGTTGPLSWTGAVQAVWSADEWAGSRPRLAANLRGIHARSRPRLVVRLLSSRVEMVSTTWRFEPHIANVSPGPPSADTSLIAARRVLPVFRYPCVGPYTATISRRSSMPTRSAGLRV